MCKSETGGAGANDISHLAFRIGDEMAGQPRKFKDAQELQDCLDRYKKYLKDENKPPTIAGLAYYTGIDRKTIYNYEKGDEYFYIIKEFRDWVIMNYEEFATGSSSSGVIFLMKNYGYTDKQEVENTGDVSFNIRWNDADNSK